MGKYREEIFRSGMETGTYDAKELTKALNKREVSEVVYLDPCCAEGKVRNVISIGKGYEFKDDVKVVLGEGFKYVDRCCFDNSECFNNCGQLTGFVAPKTLIGIGDTAFFFATKLSNVQLNEGLRFIDSDAFKKCYSLEQLVLPASLEHIGKTAFEGSGLTVLVCHENQLEAVKSLTGVDELLQIFAVDKNMLVKQILVRDFSYRKCFKESNNIDVTVKCDKHIMRLIVDTMSMLIEANPDNCEVLQELINNLPVKKLGNLAELRSAQPKKKKIVDDVVV